MYDTGACSHERINNHSKQHKTRKHYIKFIISFNRCVVLMELVNS